MPTPTFPDSPTIWRPLLWSWDAWLLNLALVLAVPALGYLRFKRLLLPGDGVNRRRGRLTLYARIIGGQWLLVGIMFLIARRHGLTATDLGVRLANERLTLGVTLALLLILAGVAAITLHRFRRAPLEKIRAGIGRVREFLPSSGGELAAFGVLSITAGVCEELLYRGWLLGFLSAATNSLWIAIAVNSAVFGIGHAYQGIKGMLRTALIGVQLALLFVGVGSLIPGQVLHAGVDLLAGAVGAIALSRLHAADVKRPES